MAKKKKTTKIKRNFEEESQLEFRLKQHRKRLGLKKPPKEAAPAKLQAYWEDRDAKMLQDKREDIKRRKKLALRVKNFGELLKEEFGRRIKVVMYLSEETDELSVLAYFKPKKGQHPFTGDPSIAEAFKKSKLDEVMFFAGTGTYLKTMERDNHFMETKWQPTKEK